MIVPPKPPSRARLKVFADSQYSYLRALEHEVVAHIPLSGRVLDFGGDHRSDYTRLLQTGERIDSLNVDARLQPTIVHDANAPFPIADACYDTIISFNTLEHIRRDEFALSELVRILKPGGQLHVIVPFLYHVHGHPSDYHRHTGFWWQATLEDLGIPADRQRIEPMMWGRLTTAFAQIEWTRLRFLRRLPLWLDLLVKGADDHAYPLGYYIAATK